MGMGRSLETLEGARMTGSLTAPYAFNGKERNVTEGQ